MGLSLIDLDVFSKKCFLTGIDIKLCARTESGIKQLLAIVTEDGNLVLHYIFGGLHPVLKHVTWFNDKEKTIQAICFDPTATWLLVITSDVSLYIVPALYIVDSKQKIDCKWALNDLTCFPRHEKTPSTRPMSIIWWQTLDCNQNAIVGHEDGSISFISLTDGQNIGVCGISDPVAMLHIYQDNCLDSVTLLITNTNRQQWRLLLEQRSNSYTWSPEHNVNVQTTTEYVINGLKNGHMDDIKTSRSRLQGLKQLSVEKLASLKQKLAETRSRALNGNQKVIAEDQRSTGSNDSNNSQPDSTIPERLSQLCATYLCPQFARNNNLFSGYYKPTSVLTLHSGDVDVTPMYVHKLCPECYDVLVTDRFFYITNEQRDRLTVISCQFSESRLDGDTEFNEDSIISQFSFDEEILAIFKLSDVSLSEAYEDERRKAQKNFVLAKSESDLILRKPKMDTCVVVTKKNVYKIVQSCSVVEKFVSLVTENVVLDKAERLATMFGLSVQQLLEYSGDLLLSQEKFSRAIALYRLSKCRILKSVLKFAVSGHCQELLSYISVCLSATNTDMSVSTKKHLSNLAIMAYTEILLRTSTNVLHRLSNVKRFVNFLVYNEYYDEVLAVNVVCQTALWSILGILAKTRGLTYDVVEVLCKVMKSSNADKVSSLRELDFNEDCFHSCLSDRLFLGCIVARPQFSKILLGYIKDNLSTFSVNVLKQLSNSLDPSSPVAWSVISKVFLKQKFQQSSSLDSTLDSVDSEPPDELLHATQDLVETFIYVLLWLVHGTKADAYDISLLQLIEVQTEEESTKFSALLYPKTRVLSAGFGHVGLIRNNSLYMWGSAVNGCLGLGPVVTKYCLPQNVEAINGLQVDIIAVSCGKNHSMLLTNYGVYMFGSNVYGQLGVGSDVYQAPYPTLVESLTQQDIVDVSAGQYHSMALTSEGKVYTWGWGVHGQLGHGDVHDAYRPKLVDKLSDRTIVQISAGHAHSIVLSSEGIVYSFGSNSFGQLGNGTSVKSSVPVQILLNEQISMITTSYFHNLAVTTDNKLYVWGASPQVLRHQVHNYRRTKFTQSEKNCDSPAIDWSLTTPFSIDNHHLFPSLVTTDTVDSPITQISAGCNHSALITKDGSLYTWGQNLDGQIGNGSRSEVSTPTVVRVNPLNTLNSLNAGTAAGNKTNLKCSFVSCGADYTVVVDHIGRVLAWGNNSRAQLGKIADEDDRGLDGKMVMLKATKRILKIPKSCQSMTDVPKEVTNLPTLHITYHNYNKRNFVNKKMAHMYPLHKIERHLTKVPTNAESFYVKKMLAKVQEDCSQPYYSYRQRTLHYVLQTFFGLYDADAVLHKSVELKNLQAASKLSYLGGHFGDSLGFQLAAFKAHMDREGWGEGALPPPEPAKPVERAARVIVNPVSFISTSVSLESIKQFNDELEQGGFEELCDDASFKTDRPRDSSVDNLKLILNSGTSLPPRPELVDVVSDPSEPPADASPPQRNQDDAADENVFSNDVIRKTVANYVESLDASLLDNDHSTIPRISDIYTDVSSDLGKIDISISDEDTAEVAASPQGNLVDLASRVIEFYCSRPQILENHILVQNILIRSMQFWLTSGLPVDVLENILLKNMDKYFYPLSILLFCKNFNNNLGEGMVKDDETRKTQRSFEFLKQLSTKFCLQLCSMVLQNVNKS